MSGSVWGRPSNRSLYHNCVIGIMFKLEVSLLLLGLLSGSLMFALVTWWGIFPVGFREFFQAGNTGAQFLAYFLMGGFIGAFLLPINLFLGHRKLWWLRIIGAVWMLLSSITFGLAV